MGCFACFLLVLFCAMGYHENMKKVLVFSGAGMSKESGLATFRDEAGLWAEHDIEDVCTPEALLRDRKTVIDFYNQRRRELLAAQPHAGHLAVAEMERYCDVQVVTQNIDDLHERAGSTKVLHLHGELRKLRSSQNPRDVYPIEGWEQLLGDRADDDSLLRPFVVFFGEDVPMYEKAVVLMEEADVLVIVGTSLEVSPASYLVRYIRPDVPVWMVDPDPPERCSVPNAIHYITEGAAVGLRALLDRFSVGVFTSK